MEVTQDRQFQLVVNDEVRNEWQWLITSLSLVKGPPVGPGVQDCNSAKIQKIFNMPGEPAGDSSGCNNSSCKFPLPLHYFLAVLSTGVEGRELLSIFQNSIQVKIKTDNYKNPHHHEEASYPFLLSILSNPQKMCGWNNSSASHRQTYVTQTPSRLTISLKVFSLGGFSSNWGRNHTVTDINDLCKKQCFHAYVDMRKEQQF